jgi:ribose transport system substrate-binding protein
MKRITMWRRRLALVAVAAAVAVVSAVVMAPNGAAQEKKSVTIGFASPVYAQAVQQAIGAGMKEAAKPLGWKVKVLDANLNPDKQLSDFQTLLSQKAKGIVISALNPPALQGAYAQARKQNVALIGQVSPNPGINTNVHWEVYGCYKGGSTDKTVAYIKKRNPKAEVITIEYAGYKPIVERRKCFERKAKAAGLKLVANIDDRTGTGQNVQADVTAILQKHPNVKAIWAFNNTTSLAASAAVTASGRKVWSGSRKGVVISGADAEPAAIAAIKQGRLTLIWDPQGKALGYAAIYALKPVINGGKPLSSMPKQIIIDSKMWDISNVKGYVDPMKRKVSINKLPFFKRR